MIRDNKKSKSFINDKGLVPKTTITVGVDGPVAERARKFIEKQIKNEDDRTLILEILGIPYDL